MNPPGAKPGRSHYSVAALALASALLLSACPGPDGVDLCQCPNLVEIVATIDWIGDGTLPDKVETGVGLREYPLGATASFESSEATLLQRRIEDRLKSAGFDVVDDGRFGARFDESGWSVSVRSFGTAKDLKVLASVLIVDKDEAAEEILAPLVETLGMRP